VSKHTCHWPGCEVEVPPKKWGCLAHWLTLPAPLRRRILNAYVPGQEITKTPSKEYIEAALAVREWIRGYLDGQRERIAAGRSSKGYGPGGSAL
jgi:hypothetical protein